TSHLGRPERAWRALSQWRSSWLSREGIASLVTYLPMLAVAWLAFAGDAGSRRRAAFAVCPCDDSLHREHLSLDQDHCGLAHATGTAVVFHVRTVVRRPLVVGMAGACAWPRDRPWLSAGAAGA